MANRKVYCIKPLSGEFLKRNIQALILRAQFVPQSLNEETRTVEMIWTTGARVRRVPWFDDPYNEELSLDPKHVRMDRLQNGAPLLNSHNGWSLSDVIGVVERASIDGKEGKATVRFSDREDVQPIFRDVKNGIIRNVSVGYRVFRYEDVSESDDKIKTLRAVDWEPFELSLVPIPADAKAQVRGDHAEDHECEIVLKRDLDERGSKMPPKEEVTTEKPVVQPVIDEAKIKAEAAAEERKRAAEIKLAVRAAKLSDEFAEKLIADGTKIDEARKLIIDEWAKGDGPQTKSQVRVEVTTDDRDKWVDGAGQWLMQRAGVGSLVEKHSGSKLSAGEFRGMSMLDLARESLERNGVKTRGMDKMAIVGMALTHRGGGYQTTSDFAVLLENTLHKVLLAAYATTPDTWRRFCAKGSVSDFRDHNRYRKGSFGRLDKVLEHGEFKNKTIPDGSKEKIKAETFGNIIGISRQSIINDDLGAFNSLAVEFGRSSSLSVEVDVYALLALNAGLGPTMNDGDTLFHANHKNLGAGAALSVSSLDENRVVMASQKDPSGNEILDLRPSILVLPIGLGGDARVINDAQYDPDTANKLQRPNKVRGLFRDIVDTPRMSGTRRYLFADPSVAPVLEVVFLDGQETPFLENKDGWKVDGVEWKVRLDYGVGAIDTRGAVTDAGQ